MKKITKFFAIVLSLCLIFSICPFGAFAENVPEVVSIQCNDVVMSPSNGSFYNSVDPSTGETKSYYHYYVSTPVFSITFSDGVTVTSENSQVTYCGSTYTAYTYGDTGEQSYDNQWLPGNTYPVTCSIFSNTGENFQGSFNVTISESDIKSIQLNDINLYEELDSQTITDYSNSQQKYVEYTNYNINASSLSGSVVFSDGKTQSISYGGVSYNNKYYYANIANPQSPDNVWKVGGTYPVTAFMDGVLTTFNVHICENPVESVEFEDIEVLESKNGYTYSPNVTVKFKDGTKKTQKSNYGFQFENKSYWFSFTDNQVETPWEVGNTYTVTGTIMGVSSQFSVSVVKPDIKSFIIYDQVCLEEYDNSRYSYENKYRYNINGELIFGNGDKVDISYDSFWYNDVYYKIDISDTQEIEKWEGGNFYSVNASVLRVTTEFTVAIKEFPYKDFSVDDIVIPLNELNHHGVEPTFHLTRNDGSIYDSSGVMALIDEGCWIDIDVLNQPNEWNVGEYTLTAQFGKLSTTFTVTVTDKEENGFTYLETADGIIITGSNCEDEILTIPNKLGDKTVLGISGFGKALNTVKELIISDGIKFLSDDVFYNCWYCPLETLRIGKDLETFNAEILVSCSNLKNIFVSTGNHFYSDYDGVLYNKSQSQLVWYPLAKDKKIVLLGYVEDYSVLDLPCYYDYFISFDGGNYVTVDGITYNADKTYLISCDKEKSGSYVMPDTVVDIRNCAFENCKKLTDVTISENVTSITYRAFAGCDSLKSIDLPTNLKSLDECAVIDCNSLVGISLPQGLEKIGDHAFQSNTSLQSINFPDSLTYIGNFAFSNTGFKEISLPSDENITNNPESVFSNCNNLEKVTFANGTKNVYPNMFYSCDKLKSVTMPDTVLYICRDAFSFCSSLTDLNLSNNLKSIGKNAFDHSGLISISLPDSITQIDELAFGYSENLKTVTIGTGISILPYFVFAGTAIEKIIIPQNVTVIGEGAFIGCSMLKDVTIENDDAEVDSGAFAYCPLEDIPIPKNSKVIKIEAYKSSSAKSVEIPDTVTEIMYGAFEDSTDLLDIKMPTHLDALGRAAFDNTAWYNTKPNGYITIDNYLLYGYKGNFEKDAVVEIDDNISVLAGGVFENCLHGSTSNIKRIILPNGIKEIPKYAFDGCIKLKSVTVPVSVENIAYDLHDASHRLSSGSAFYNCLSLEDIYYLGTKEQWNSNPELYKAIPYGVKIHYINEYKPIKISINTPPNKSVYEVGEMFDSSGLSITLEYPDERKETVTNSFTVSGFDSSKLGENNLTVSYGELTCTCPITIEPHKVATSGKCGENITWKLNLDTGILNISGNGDMYDYANTDTPWFESLSDIKSVVFGKDVTTISAGTFSNCENLKSITVYNANTVINDYIDDFITVIGNYGSKAHRYAIKNGYEFIPFPETIEIFALPKQTVFAVGEDFDTNGLAISVCNPNGTVEYRYKGFTVSGYDNEKVGKQTLTVDYLGMTATFEIEVKDDIIISNPNAQDLTRLIGMLLQTETTYLSYDFNCDGVVNILDLVKIKKYIAYK